MNNRRNFDMDVSPSDNNNENKPRKNSNKTTLLVCILCILVVVGLIYVKFSFFNDTTKKETVIVEQTENKASEIVEPISTSKSTNSDSVEITVNENVADKTTAPTVKDSSTVSDSKPASTTSNTVAMDLGGAKNEKQKEGAVKFQDHIVMEGETLQTISKLYGLKVQTLISINSIKNVAGITQGAVLSIPDRNGQYYTVKSGDMLSTIANKYCPSYGWQNLQILNGLDDTKLDVGDRIFIPDMSEISLSPAMSTAGNNFTKPTGGVQIARYGQFIENNPYNDSTSLDGILLQGGGVVQASSDGIISNVIMPTADLLGTVKITHKQGYETVYKNLQDINVKVGQKVESGDNLGNVALIGENKRPILYFSIIQSGIPLDPAGFF